jgi:hypoxanthine phosphoribosyltransferase
LLVEDIVDGGGTLDRLLPLLEGMEPKSLEVCVLLHKRSTALTREPRWVGFDAPQDFLVGYGLDHAEAYRHLPFIGSV